MIIIRVKGNRNTIESKGLHLGNEHLAIMFEITIAVLYRKYLCDGSSPPALATW